MRGYSGPVRSTRRQLLADCDALLGVQPFFLDQHELALTVAAEVLLNRKRRDWLRKYGAPR